MKKTQLVGLGASIVFLVIGWMVTQGLLSGMTSVTGSEGTASLEEFNRIQSGMTYAEVVEIIGGEGTEQSSVNIPGAPITVTYSWDGSGGIGANMNAMFQNGRLVSKAQFGLQ